jgi:DNA (cytosine-5)-methyltransferase 1
MGLDLGLESAGHGIRTSVALEINPTAVKTIQLNKPDLPVLNRPIEDVSTEDILKTAGLKPGEAFAVTGGPCCQSFSTAGRRESLGDPKRGGLFRHFTKVVSEARPRFFIMENVKGVLSAAVQHRSLNERGAGWPPLSPDEELGSALKVICRELARLNYYVIFGLLNCADYGVPQKRFRVVFIGSRDGETIRLPKPTHFESKSPKWVTLRQAVGKVADTPHEFVEFTKERAQFLRRLKAGENWTDLPATLQKAALGQAFHSWGGRVGFCRRLDWNKPSPTLTTAPDGRATTLCHPTELRPLSVQEYVRLQQFPREWKFAGSTNQKYIQIGNAVPLGLGRAIGLMLLDTIHAIPKSKLKNDANARLGKVICADSELDTRLANRPKTKLHPPRLRKVQDPKAARRWMSLVAA